MVHLFKSTTKWLVPYGLYTFLKQSKFIGSYDLLNVYYKGKIKPLSSKYQEAKHELVKSVLCSRDELKAFEGKLPLPSNYGVFDERVVEYPWVFSNLNKVRGCRLLDIGPVLNYEFYLDHLLNLAPNSIIMVSLTPEANCFYHKSVSYLLGDTRSLPFISNYFDQITCISTLEHIGMDNTKYGSVKENNEEDYLVALSEMKRILKPLGSLLITVPYGIHKNFGWFQQFDKPMIDKLIEVFSPSTYELTFYKYTSDGWILSTAELSSSAMYNLHRPNDLSFYTSFPICAGAVACIKLIK